MDRAHWTSPSFRGRSPHPRHSNPRFRGDGGNSFGTPRHFSPHWQQRSPSPYRFQNQQGHGGSYTPHYHQGHHPHPYATSTPVHGSGGGRRPYFRGGGGGGRFNKRQSFGSPSFNKGSSSDDIESWISPEMWADPWRHLNPDTSSKNTTGFSSIVPSTSEQEGTRFAVSDFSIPSGLEGDLKDTQSTEASRTKFAESDFNVTDSKSRLEEEVNQQSTTSPSSVVNPDTKLKSSDEEDVGSCATDRVVLDTTEELLS